MNIRRFMESYRAEALVTAILLVLTLLYFFALTAQPRPMLNHRSMDPSNSTPGEIKAADHLSAISRHARGESQ